MKRVKAFCDGHSISNLISKGGAPRQDRRSNKWVCFMEGRRYKIVADFEELVEKECNIQLSSVVTNAVPKVIDDPELMSDAVIYFASELASTFQENPLDLSVRDQSENDHGLTQETPSEPWSSSIDGDDLEFHVDDRPADTSVHESPQTSDSRSVSRRKERWSAEDTATAEAVFFEEFMGSVAEGRRVPKGAIKLKANHPNHRKVVNTLIDKYGIYTIYKKLYSLRRKEIKKNRSKEPQPLDGYF